MTVFIGTPNIQQGWECPKCGRVYSPSTSMCLTCPQPTVTITDNSQTFCDHEYGEKNTAGRHCKKCGMMEPLFTISWPTRTLVVENGDDLGSFTLTQR
jgi:uncharacterized OB-fold protein